MTAHLWMSVLTVATFAAPLTASAPPPPWRPRQRDEAELLKDLKNRSVEMDVSSIKGHFRLIEQRLSQDGKQALLNSETQSLDRLDWSAGIRSLAPKYPQLAGLRFLPPGESVLSAERSKILSEVSRLVRGVQSRHQSRRTGTVLTLQEAARQIATALPAGRDGRVPETVYLVLEHILQGEAEPLRRSLIKALGERDSPATTQALARRAVFEPSKVLRWRAFQNLRSRAAKDSRPVLLAALEHPWGPAAEHASIALVNLKDTGAIPALKRLKARYSPLVTSSDSPKPRARELVRVNHLRNCALCHPPFMRGVRVSCFSADLPDPRFPVTQNLYGTGRLGTITVDIVILRQDFSVMHKVDKPGTWPAMQRYDYVLREREVTATEAKRLLASREPSIQRKAIQYALEELQAIKKKQ